MYAVTVEHYQTMGDSSFAIFDSLDRAFNYALAKINELQDEYGGEECFTAFPKDSEDDEMVLSLILRFRDCAYIAVSIREIEINGTYIF
jgi:hypothetical protein